MLIFFRCIFLKWYSDATFHSPFDVQSFSDAESCPGCAMERPASCRNMATQFRRRSSSHSEALYLPASFQEESRVCLLNFPCRFQRIAALFPDQPFRRTCTRVRKEKKRKNHGRAGERSIKGKSRGKRQNRDEQSSILVESVGGVE